MVDVKISHTKDTKLPINVERNYPSQIQKDKRMPLQTIGSCNNYKDVDNMDQKKVGILLSS